MMRLFNTVTDATTFIKNDQGMTLANAKLYVEANIANKVDDKVWVILP